MKVKLRAKKDPNAAPVAAIGWGVRICTAERKMRTYVYDVNPNYERVEGKIAVRLTYNGEDAMSFGILNVDSPTFEEAVTTMKAAAEDKACALNAVGAVA